MLEAFFRHYFAFRIVNRLPCEYLIERTTNGGSWICHHLILDNLIAISISISFKLNETPLGIFKLINPSPFPNSISVYCFHWQQPYINDWRSTNKMYFQFRLLFITQKIHYHAGIEIEPLAKGERWIPSHSVCVTIIIILVAVVTLINFRKKRKKILRKKVHVTMKKRILHLNKLVRSPTRPKCRHIK